MAGETRRNAYNGITDGFSYCWIKVTYHLKKRKKKINQKVNLRRLQTPDARPPELHNFKGQMFFSWKPRPKKTNVLLPNEVPYKKNK